MTPEQLAARVLADCPRYRLTGYDAGTQPDCAGEYVHRSEALAAIARHLAPGDDLVAQATAALEGVTEGPWAWSVRGFVGPASIEDDQSFGMICDEVAECTYSDGQKEANARFIAFTRQWVPEAAARLSAITAERDAMRARLARMEGALPSDRAISDLAYLMWSIHPNEIAEQGYTHILHGGKYQNPRQAWYCDHIKALIAPARAALTQKDRTDAE